MDKKLSEKQEDDLFYVCSLIEYIARVTFNYRKDIIKFFSKEVLDFQLKSAEANHCLSFEQVSEELIEKLKIKNGTFDSVKSCRYQVPSYMDVGKVFQRLILSVYEKNEQSDLSQCIIDVFSSFISDEISNFNSSVYYANPSYLFCSYEEGKLSA
ncbi:MAG: hypothetical protein UIB61_10695 [Treponema sp.]|jgi:hypothetical protein|nr:hypothetical protein [Treponema sp.]